MSQENKKFSYKNVQKKFVKSRKQSQTKSRPDVLHSEARSSGSYLGDHLSLSQQPSNLSTFSNRSNLRTPCKDLVSAFSSQTSLQSNYMVKSCFLLIVYSKALYFTVLHLFTCRGFGGIRKIGDWIYLQWIRRDSADL